MIERAALVWARGQLSNSRHDVKAGLRSDDGSLVGLRGGQSADVPGLSGTKIRIAGLTLVKREGISAVERPGRCLGLLCGGRLE
jgi:hypothetical protein